MSSLKQEIKNYQKETKNKVPREVLEKLQNSKDAVISKGSKTQHLKETYQMPSFQLPDQTGNIISSDELLKKGPLVISFYRGGWCPYCNLELRSLQDHLEEFKENGATLVAISPEQPDGSLDVSEKNNLQFSVLSDDDNIVAKKFGIVFETPTETDSLYKELLNLDLAKRNSTDKPELPIPATYVVGQDGKITYAFVNADYTKRAEPSEIIKVLKKPKN